MNEPTCTNCHNPWFEPSPNGSLTCCNCGEQRHPTNPVLTPEQAAQITTNNQDGAK